MRKKRSGTQVIMANKNCLPVPTKDRNRFAYINIKNSHSPLSTEDSDISPLPVRSVQSLYRGLSLAAETQARALTCSLQRVCAALEVELVPVNLRERKEISRSCPLQGVGSSPLMQRRAQRISLTCSVVT